jgi:hypothetical protein
MTGIKLRGKNKEVLVNIKLQGKILEEIIERERERVPNFYCLG